LGRDLCNVLSVADCLLQTELQLPVSQALALFVKVARKISKKLVDIQKAAISAQMPDAPVPLAGGGGAVADWEPVGASLEEELTEAGREVTSELRERQREMIDALDLKK
jgi:N-acetyltransferase 10